MSTTIDAQGVDAKLGKTTYRLTEEPSGNLKITRYAIDNTVTGTFFVPRALFVAYARVMITQFFNQKIQELFQ